MGGRFGGGSLFRYFWPFPGAAEQRDNASFRISQLCGCFAVCSSGERLERGLEKISTFIVIWIAVFSCFQHILSLPGFVENFTGLFQFGYFPKVRLGYYWGGLPPIPGWWPGKCLDRQLDPDKGFGMGSLVGQFPAR